MTDLTAQLNAIMPTAITGSVVRLVGMTASVAGFPAPLGSIVEIERQPGGKLLAEVVGFRDELTLVYPLGDLGGVRRGNQVRLARTSRWLPVGEELLGRVVDADGRVVDGRPQPMMRDRVPRNASPPRPTDRPRIDQPLATGVRAIDALLTCGKGQRVGVFSGSGVGKSVALGMMCRNTSADVAVVALIGERGREVKEFIQRDLGRRGLDRSVVVVAASNEPPLMRVNAAVTATSISEYFRDRGADVLLVMDSLTRFALALREIGLAAGEPPATRGYPPSVFSMLPRLVERAGQSPRGSITGFYSVLVEADDPNEPISDAVRGLLDGHFWLSRKLASRGHYPAVDILESISRLQPEVTSSEQQRATLKIRELLAAYREHEDLISIGAYRRGSQAMVDAAIDMRDDIERFLRQQMDESSSLDDARRDLVALAQKAEKHTSASPAPARLITSDAATK